jgi:hypothetical protein
MTLTFPLYDSSFTPGVAAHTTAQGFQRVWWTGSADLSGSAGFDPSQATITKIALIAKNGGISPVTNQVIAPGTPVFLDFETDETESANWYQQRIKWFHQAAPNVKVGIWGLPLGWAGLDEDIVASDTPDVISQIDDNLRAEAPYLNNVNMITLSAYLLGPASVNTTLKWISVLAGEYHKMYPGKEVVCWMWGAYHTSWNPANDVASDAVTQEYIQTAMSNCDSMLVWGPDADNVKIKQMAYQMDVAASTATETNDTSLFSDSSITSTDLTSVIQ